MKSVRNFMIKAKELIVANQFILYLAVFLLAFFVFLAIQSYPSFLDPDSFYHLKMTKLIAESGPVINFPWLQFTVLKDFFIDQHFLYHVLGVPFVSLLGDFAGYKFYTIILNTLLIFGCYLFFKKEKIRCAEIFAVLLLSSQGFIFRISLAKASAFSLIFLFIGIYLIFKRKNLWLFVLSWLYVLAYGGFFLIWVMASFYILADSIYLAFIAPAKEHKIIKRIKAFFKNIFSVPNLKLGLATISGVVLGLIINPYFPKNLKFIWEQLVQIGLINYVGKVNVGGEWYPYSFSDLAVNIGVSFILGIIVFVLFIITVSKQKPKSIFFLISTLFFLFFTLKSKRYIEYLAPHWVFFMAFALSYSLQNINLREHIKKLFKINKLLNVLLFIVIMMVVIFFPLIIVQDISRVYHDFRRGIPLDQFHGVGQYLIKNSQPGDIIMQTDWDDFPSLFYQNSKDYYIVGLDPTFMYNYNPKLYNLFADITITRISSNLSQLIKDNFKASYFVVDKDRDQLNKNLQADSGFVKVYEDKDCWLYRVK